MRHGQLISIIFESEPIREKFLREFGPDGERAIINNLAGQLGGQYEVVSERPESEAEILGAVPFDEFGDFYLVPAAGDCRKQYLEEVVPQLMRHITKRILDIFGPEGLEGTFEEYEWLMENYSVSEEDDVKWVDLLHYYNGDLDENPSIATLSDEERAEVMRFVSDKEAHLPFLFEIVHKYDASRKRFPRRTPR